MHVYVHADVSGNRRVAVCVLWGLCTLCTDLAFLVRPAGWVGSPGDLAFPSYPGLGLQVPAFHRAAGLGTQVLVLIQHVLCPCLSAQVVLS